MNIPQFKKMKGKKNFSMKQKERKEKKIKAATKRYRNDLSRHMSIHVNLRSY